MTVRTADYVKQVKLAKLEPTGAAYKSWLVFCHCSLQLDQRCPILSFQPSMDKSGCTVLINWSLSLKHRWALVWLEWTIATKFQWKLKNNKCCVKITNPYTKHQPFWAIYAVQHIINYPKKIQSLNLSNPITWFRFSTLKHIIQWFL